VWARTIGVILATVSAIANFAFIPYYPVWSLAIIAVDIFVIWALTAHGRDIAEP
jgi:NADH:ubiquinone oxidoreductase subunit H